MITHVSLLVSDLDRSKELYGKMLSPLEYRLIRDLSEKIGALGFGDKEYPDVWLDPSNIETN